MPTIRNLAKYLGIVKSWILEKGSFSACLVQLVNRVTFWEVEVAPPPHTHTGTSRTSCYINWCKVGAKLAVGIPSGFVLSI